MSNFGIGLGAFAQGMANGINMGEKINESRYKKAKMEREQNNQEQLDNFDTQSKQQFDKGVQAGTYKPEDLSNFLAQYRGPQREALLIQQGDYKGAKAWKDWYTSEAAQKGTQLFGSALLKAQSGDVSGAIDDAVNAAQVKGYLDHTYKLGAKDPIKDDQGNVVGYSVHLKNNDGEDLNWDVSKDNVETGIAHFFNPESAYQTQVAAQQAKAKADLEVGTYGRKKAIDDKYAAKDDARDQQNKLALEREKKKLGTGGKDPSNVREATWLATIRAREAGRDAPNDQDKIAAYEEVKRSKGDANAKARLIASVYGAMKKDYRDRRSDEEKWQAATDRIDQTIEALDGGSDKPKRTPSPAPGLGGKNRATKQPKTSPATTLPIPPSLKGVKEGATVKSPEGALYVVKDGQLVLKKK